MQYLLKTTEKFSPRNTGTQRNILMTHAHNQARCAFCQRRYVLNDTKKYFLHGKEKLDNKEKKKEEKEKKEKKREEGEGVVGEGVGGEGVDGKRVEGEGIEGEGGVEGVGGEGGSH